MRIVPKYKGGAKYLVKAFPGYQLKSLMMGSPLEKLLAADGAINIRNLGTYINTNGSKVEKGVIQQVLANQFPGLNKVDYNTLKEAVLKDLIMYDRKPSTKWATYGMDRLGYLVSRKPDGAGGILEYIPGVPTNTFLFTSLRIPYGNNRHYNSNTLGHSRTFTDQNILHVLESLSDWGLGEMPKDREPSFFTKMQDRANNLQKEIDVAKQLLDKGLKPDGTPIKYDYERKMIQLDVIDLYLARLGAIKQRYFDASVATFPERFPQYKYLHDNYAKRQLLENLRYAAEQGLTKMRYPTPETAAKIEGFPGETRYVDKSGNILDSPYKYDDVILKQYCEAVNRALELRLRGTEADIPLYEQALETQLRLYRALEDTKQPIDNVKTVTEYQPEHQTILNKYIDFPKQFKKLIPDLEVRTVTDNKGNSWYEVDVPKGYLLWEWQFKNGGLIKNRIKINHT